MNIAINGFGRIGRAVFRAYLNKKNDNFNIVAVNDPTDNKTLAHLLKYDSCYGILDKQVDYDDDNLIVDGIKYRVFGEKDPGALPWGDLGVDIVIESTGFFRTRELAQKHIDAGAKRVIISAPAKSDDIKDIILSVNEQNVEEKDDIVSMASCTSNCLAPVTEVIKDKFGIQKAIMSTIHSYTSDQRLVDGSHKDPRRARAAAVNIVPTTTGAAVAVAKAIPEIKGKFDGMSLRVPTPVVSLCDIVFLTGQKVSEEEVNQALEDASKSQKYNKIISITKEPLVSSDFIGNPASSIVDLSLTKVIEGDLVKIISWYDNEWGYSNRLIDLCEYFLNKFNI